MATVVLHKQISLPEVKILIGEILKILNEIDIQLPEFETNYRICNNALSLMYNSLPDKSQNINRIFREVTILIDDEKCNGCLRCMNVCKQRAIEVTRYR